MKKTICIVLSLILCVSVAFMSIGCSSISQFLNDNPLAGKKIDDLQDDPKPIIPIEDKKDIGNIDDVTEAIINKVSFTRAMELVENLEYLPTKEELLEGVQEADEESSEGENEDEEAPEGENDGDPEENNDEDEEIILPSISKEESLIKCYWPMPNSFYDSLISEAKYIKRTVSNNIVQLDVWVQIFPTYNNYYKLSYDAEEDVAVIEYIGKWEKAEDQDSYYYYKIISTYNENNNMYLSSTICRFVPYDTYFSADAFDRGEVIPVDVYYNSSIIYVENEYVQLAAEETGLGTLAGTDIHITPPDTLYFLFEKDLSVEGEAGYKYIRLHSPTEYSKQVRNIDPTIQTSYGIILNNENVSANLRKTSLLSGENVDSHSETQIDANMDNHYLGADQKVKLIKHSGAEFVLDYLEGYKDISYVINENNYKNYTIEMNDGTIYTSPDLIYSDADVKIYFQTNDQVEAPVLCVIKDYIGSELDLDKALEVIESLGFSFTYDVRALCDTIDSAYENATFMGYENIMDINSPKEFFDLYERLFPEYLDKQGVIEKYESLEDILQANEQEASSEYLELVSPIVSGTVAIDNNQLDLTNLVIEIPNNTITKALEYCSIMLRIKNETYNLAYELAKLELENNIATLKFLDLNDIVSKELLTEDCELEIYLYNTSSRMILSDAIKLNLSTTLDSVDPEE